MFFPFCLRVLWVFYITNENVHRMRKMLDNADGSSLVENLRLQFHMQTSPKGIEQAHAAGSMVMKEHKTCAQQQLRVRALLLSQKALVQSKDSHKQLVRLLRQKSKVVRRVPTKHTAREHFLETKSKIWRHGQTHYEKGESRGHLHHERSLR